MKKIYTDTIEIYNEKEVICALNKAIKFDEIYRIKKLLGSLANTVYVAFTNVGNYIIKKYNYDYDFELCNKLYELYELNNIKIVRPINKKVIIINNNKYNVFGYLEHSFGKLKNEDIEKLINIDRKTNKKSTLIFKCDKYYNYLNDLCCYNGFIENDELFVLSEYKKMRNMPLFKEQYLNHGDLSLKNIVFYKCEPYIIDFDETVVTTKLYDYAVLFVKNYIKDIELDYEKIKNYIISNMPDAKYSINEYLVTIRFYLCKILLEKFYLYEKGNIDLFSEVQLEDDYKQYFNILTMLSECSCGGKNE